MGICMAQLTSARLMCCFTKFVSRVSCPHFLQSNPFNPSQTLMHPHLQESWVRPQGLVRSNQIHQNVQYPWKKWKENQFKGKENESRRERIFDKTGIKESHTNGDGFIVSAFKSRGMKKSFITLGKWHCLMDVVKRRLTSSSSASNNALPLILLMNGLKNVLGGYFAKDSFG